MTPATPLDNFLHTVKAAIAEAGMEVPSDVELADLVTNAVEKCTTPDGPLPIIHIDPDELVLLTARVSAALRCAGLKGAARDNTLDATIRQAITVLDADRHKDSKRRQRIKVVK